MSVKLNFIALVLGAAFAITLSGLASAELSDALRTALFNNSLRVCSQTYLKTNESATQVTTYCTCLARGQADMTTMEDVAYIGAHKTVSEDFQNRTNALTPKCKSDAGIK
jgi:hypothetical protein